MPQYDVKCTVGQKPGDMESSIIEHAKQLGNISLDKKHGGNQMPRNVGLIEWLYRGSIEGSS